MPYLTTVTTGPEGREFNGPLMPPIWDGAVPGYREGQIYYDIAGVLDGDPGPIYWDGAVWLKYGSGGPVPTLQAVTESGASTTIDISTGSVLASKSVDSVVFEATFTPTGSQAVMQTFAVDPGGGDPVYSVSELFLNSPEINRITTREGNSILIGNDQGLTFNEFLPGGEVKGAPATASDHFVTLSQVGAKFQYDTAITYTDVTTLSSVNILFADYDEVHATNITDTAPNSIHLIRTGPATWDFTVYNKMI